MTRELSNDPVVAIVPFDQITPKQLLAAMCLRNDVFVVEQQITAEAEVDTLDGVACHVLVFEGDEALASADPFRLMGTARLVALTNAAQDTWKVGRVAVAERYRKRGIGGLILASIGEWLDAAEPVRTGVMHAQAHLETWYASHGWDRVGEIFDEANIPHVRMVRGQRTIGG